MIQVQKLRGVNNSFYRKVIAFILFLMISYAAPLKGAEIAYIFYADNLGRLGEYQTWPRYRYEIYRYTYSGYALRLRPATKKNILEALLDPETRAMTIFAHGGFNRDKVPTVLTSRANDWRRIVSETLESEYIFEGMSAEEAELKALQESQNFGLDSFTNYSCGSLATYDIANLFVRPGGLYYGVTKSYAPSPFGPLWKDSEVLLTEYRVQMQPSWGSGSPGLAGKKLAFKITWPPFGGAFDGYRDGGKLWIWTNRWYKYLVYYGEGFLEFNIRDPKKAIAVYDRDRDEDGNVIKNVTPEGKRQWAGPTKSLINESEGRYDYIEK